jgi:autotransporter-associated beta strand protein
MASFKLGPQSNRTSSIPGKQTLLAGTAMALAMSVMPAMSHAATFVATTEAELRAALESVAAGTGSNNTIVLGADITLTQFLPPISPSGSEKLVIDMDGFAVSGNKTTRIFFVNQGDVTFKDGTLTHGLAWGGDGGDGDGVDNDAGGGGMGAGGALYVRGDTGSTVTLVNVMFIENRARGGDGGTTDYGEEFDTGSGGGGGLGGNGGIAYLDGEFGGGGGGGAFDDGYDADGDDGGDGGGPFGGYAGLAEPGLEYGDDGGDLSGGGGGAIGGPGGNGGYGGGGGGAGDVAEGATGGHGGFGGGGGGGSHMAAGGNGGFGGGGGGAGDDFAAGRGGFGGGDGDHAGGGGAGFGGAIFLQEGATLIFVGSTEISGGAVRGGQGGGGFAGDGSAAGSGIFLQNSQVVFGTDADGGMMLIRDVIADDTGNGDNSGSVRINPGPHTVVFAGANTYSGGTSVGGSLALIEDGAIGSGDLVIDEGGSLDSYVETMKVAAAELNGALSIRPASEFDVGLAGDPVDLEEDDAGQLDLDSLVIGDTGSLSIGRNGTVTVAADMTEIHGGLILGPGAVLSVAGDLQFHPAPDPSLSSAFGSYVIIEGEEAEIIADSGDSTGGTISLGGDFTVSTDSSVTLTVGGDEVTNSGLLTLQDNSYFGLEGHSTEPSLINIGEVTIGEDAILSAAQFIQSDGLTENDGTLEAYLTVEGGIFINAGEITDDITVTGGELILDLGTDVDDEAALDIQGGTVTVNASDTVGDLSGGESGRLVLWDSVTLTVNQLEFGQFSGIISGEGSFEKAGEGTLLLSGLNTHSGGTIISNGTLALDTGATLGSGDVTIEGDGTLDIGGNKLTFGKLSISGRMDIGEGGEITAKTLTIDPDAIFSLGENAVATMTGNTTNIAGTLTLASNASLVDVGGINVLAGGSIDIDGFDVIIASDTDDAGDERIDNAGTIHLYEEATATITTGSDELTNSGTILLDDESSLTITGDGDVALVNTGTIEIGGFAELVVDLLKQVSGKTTNNWGLIEAEVKLLGGVFDNGGEVVGQFTVDGGTLNLEEGSDLDDESALIVHSGAVNVNESDTVGDLSGDGGTITIAEFATLTTDHNGLGGGFYGDFAGAGDFVKAGGGSLTFGGTSNLTGTIRVEEGTLVIAGTVNGDVTTAGELISEGTIGGLVTVLEDGSFFVAGDTTVSGGFINYSTLAEGVDISDGNLTGLTYFTNEGDTVIRAGRTLSAGAINNTLGTITVEEGATLEGTGNTLTNSATLDVATDGTVTDAGNIINEATGVISFNGPGGTATLNAGGAGAGEITNNGTLRVLSGNVEVGGDEVTSTGTISVATGSTLSGLAALEQTGGSLTGGGIIDVTGPVTLSGGSTLSAGTTLKASGAQTLNQTTVAGTLSGTGAVTVGGATTLSGQITAAPTVTVANGGTLTINGTGSVGSAATTINAGGVLATAANLSFGGGLRNDGQVRLTGAAGQSVTAASLAGTGSYQMALGSTLVSTGAITGTMGFDLTGTTSAALGSRTLLVNGLPGTVFSIGTVTGTAGATGPYVQLIEQDSAAGDLSVVTVANPALNHLASGLTLTELLLSGAANRPANPFTLPPHGEEACGPRVSAQATLGRAKLEGAATPAGGESDATYSALETGLQVGCADGSLNGWSVIAGLQGGFVDGSSEQAVFGISPTGAFGPQIGTITDSFRQTQGTLYIATEREGLSADLYLRKDSTKHALRESGSALGLNAANVRTDATTVGASVSYALPTSAAGFSFVPTLGISRTTAEGSTLRLADGSTLSLGGYTATTRFVGATMAQTFAPTANGMQQSASVSGTYYDQSMSARNSTLQVPGLAGGTDVLQSQGLGSFAELSVGYALDGPVGGSGSTPTRMSLGVKASARTGDQVSDAYSVTAQFRLSF